MTYLYGLLQPFRNDGVEKLSDIQGLNGSVSLTTYGDVMLLHCPSPSDGEILPRRRWLLAHARVLETAMQYGTVLPMRFGIVRNSLDDFDEILRSNAEDVKAAIDRVAGRVELGVRVTASKEDALGATLEASPALQRERKRLLAQPNAGHYAKVDFGKSLGEQAAARRRYAQKELLGKLPKCAIDHVLKPPETDFDPLRAEFLLEKADLDAFMQALEDAVEALEFAGKGGCSIKIVGPGPAFHFVRLSLDSSPSQEAA